MSDTPAAPDDFAQQVADAHGYLLKFARLQLRNETWAEDVVSETMVAALAKPQAFGGRSQLRTWLVGILKHKVVDALRSHQREVTVGETDDDNADPLDDMAFKPDGHFQERPADWGNPQPAQSIHSSQTDWIASAPYSTSGNDCASALDCASAIDCVSASGSAYALMPMFVLVLLASVGQSVSVLF